MSLNIIQSPLPFFDERKSKINSIVLHCSVENPYNMHKVLAKQKLSAHYIIGADGLIMQCVAENKRAWHAGVSFWRGAENLNHSSIGIELESKTLGQEEYPEIQIEALIKLCKQIIKRYKISPVNIMAHSDVAPKRKPDPGKAFPWQKLAQNQVGLWYDIKDAEKINFGEVSALLQKIGYDISDTAAASYAFCRHFAPEYVDENNDIKELLEKVYPADFNFPRKLLPILKACAYKFSHY